MQESFKEELEKMGIYQLRVYARQVGVKLATTLRKADLVDAVLKIMSGEKERYIKTTKKGRPPKEILNINTTSLSQSEPLFVVPNSYEYGIEGLFSKKLDTYKRKDDKTYEIVGLLDIFANGTGLIVPLNANDKLCYIGEETINNFKLLRGDMVSAMGHDIGDSMPYVLDEVVSVNGHEPNVVREKIVDAKKINGETFRVNTANNLVRIYNLTDTKINKGDRILIAGQDRRVLPQASFNISSILNTANDVNIVVIVTNVSEEYISSYSGLKNAVCIGATFGQPKEMQLKMVSLGMAYVKNLLKYENKDVVCIVPDVDEIIKTCMPEDEERCVLMFKKFFACAENVANASLTVSLGINITSEIFKEFETNENVYLKTCGIDEAKQLSYKFNWISCSRNELADVINSSSGYGYTLASFLKRGNYVDRQRQIEDWSSMGLEKSEIEQKMKENL